ncbi:MAG: redoxin domain-containing protein [Chloroflexi bacterium]|nr:redoxin domain-containing protein [Chloroflexota bacterium]
MEQNRSNIGRSFLIVVVGIAALAGVAFIATLPSAPAASAPASSVDPSTLKVAPTQGSLAPDFSLFNLEGEQITLSELRGHPVMINLWATWCAPCRIEMPHIQDRFERYANEGFIVLAVDFDEPAGLVEEFRDELGLTFDVLLDPGAEVQELYRNRSYPSTFFVDENGVIQVQHIGLMTEGQLDENLAAIGLES